MKRIFFLFLGFPLLTLAQTYNTPVRRAEAVNPPEPLATPSNLQNDPNLVNNPAWMQRVAPAPTPASPAKSTPTPKATPYRPSSSSAPLPATKETAMPPISNDTIPLSSVTKPATVPQNDDASSIRIAPVPPAEPGGTPRVITSTKDYADGFFARKMYDLAIPEYQKFLSESPKHTDRASAWFRLGESLRIQKKPSAARGAYEGLLRETRSGEFAGAAAYRLAGILMEEKQYSGAAANFEIAAKESQDAAVRLSATFFAARSYELLGDQRPAFQNFEKVRKMSAGDTRYEEYSLVAMSKLAVALGKKAQAITLYEELAKTTPSAELRNDARLKIAQFLLDENRIEEARSVLDGLATQKDSPKAVATARYGLLEIDAHARNFSQIIKLTPEEIATFDEAARPRAMLLLANAYRQLEKYSEALALYDQIIKKYPQSPSVKEARFHRLICLFRKEDPTLLESIAQFLKGADDAAEIDQARLLKAEAHFKAEQWAEAADAYATLTSAKLSETLLADAIFKNAWCLARIGQHQKAVVAYSDFITRFPKHDSFPQALVGRGMAHLENGAQDAAVRDFDRVLQSYPESKESEIALLQRALAYGSRRDYAKMKTDFETLVTKYPDSPARAQAEFWIAFAKFEAKDYEGCLPHFEEARTRDATAYASRASLRTMLAYYYLDRPTETAKEIEQHKISNVPAEVYQWLAAKFLEKGNQAEGEKYLQIVLDGQAGNAATPELYLQLAQSRILQKKFAAAQGPITKYLEIVKDPTPRAKGFMIKAEALIGEGKLDEAQKFIEDAQQLQPEGRLNAEARLLSGKLHVKRGNHAEAAKVFMTIAVLYDDETLTPEALRLAAESYRRANNPTEAEKALEELRRRYPKYSETSVKNE